MTWIVKPSRGLFNPKSMNVQMKLIMWPATEVLWSLGGLTETLMGAINVLLPQTALLLRIDAKSHELVL